MVGNTMFYSPERLGEGEMDGRGGENYGDLGNRRIDEEDDEREGEDEDSDEDQADNGDEQQYDGYPMQFNDRDSTIQDTQIRNGR